MLRRSGTIAWALLKDAGATARRRWLILLCSTAIVLVMTLVLRHWDPVLTAWLQVHQGGAWVPLAQQLSHWGELHLVPLFSLLLLAGVGWLSRSPPLSISALAGLLAGCTGGILVNILKWVVGRPRPSVSLPDGINWFHLGFNYASFPSGHATHCSAIVAAVMVLAPRTGMAMALASLAIAWSRWYLLRHYVSDLWAGASLGLTIGVIFGFAARRYLAQRAADLRSSPQEITAR